MDSTIFLLLPAWLNAFLFEKNRFWNCQNFLHFMLNVIDSHWYFLYSKEDIVPFLWNNSKILTMFFILCHWYLLYLIKDFSFFFYHRTDIILKFWKYSSFYIRRYSFSVSHYIFFSSYEIHFCYVSKYQKIRYIIYLANKQSNYRISKSRIILTLGDHNRLRTNKNKVIR